MVDYNVQLLSLIKEAVGTKVGVYFEMFDKQMKVPCVSYMESDNYTQYMGTKLKYSNVQYIIKVWDKTLRGVWEIAKNIDSKLESQGFTRTSSYDMTDGGYVVKVLQYEAVAYENII